MSQPLVSMRYTSQHPTMYSDSNTSHLLLNLSASSVSPPKGVHRWALLSTGEVSSESLSRIRDAWSVASIDGCSREVWVPEAEEAVHEIDQLSSSDLSIIAQLKDVSVSIREAHWRYLESTDFSETGKPNRPERTTLDGDESMSDLIEQEEAKADTETELESTSTSPLDQPQPSLLLDQNLTEVDLDKTEEVSASTFQILAEQKNVAHLIIILGRGARRETSMPPEHELSLFQSITLIAEAGSHDPIKSWLTWYRWGTRLGVQILWQQDSMVTKLSKIIQNGSYGIGRSTLHIKAGEGIKFQSLTAITPHGGAIQIDPQEAHFVAPNMCDGERISYLIGFQEEAKDTGESRPLATCNLDGVKHTIYSNSQLRRDSDLHHPGVSFAQQLSHRARCFDGLLYAYSRKELRRVVQYLDQWLKVSLALEKEEVASWIHQQKVKFLSIGTFQPHDLDQLILHGMDTPYRLSPSGSWVRSPSQDL